MLIGLLKLLLSPADEGVIIRSGEPAVRVLPDPQGFPQSAFAEDTETDSLKSLEGSDARWIAVPQFDPADAFADPTQRIVKIRIGFSYAGDQLFQSFAIDQHLF